MDEQLDHCRLEQEYIMAVVRNRSGQYSGEIDFNIKSDRLNSLSKEDLLQTIKILNALSNICKAKL